MRILNHPILGRLSPKRWIEIEVDGEKIKAIEGDPIATALIASGRHAFRYTERFSEPRGIFCAIGRCWEKTNHMWNGWVCVTAPLAC